MSETKKINKKLRTVMSMAVSFDAAIREMMAAMIDDEGDFVDPTNDETIYDECLSLRGQLENSIELLGDIYKNRVQNQRRNETKAWGEVQERAILRQESREIYMRPLGVAKCAGGIGRAGCQALRAL